MQECIKKFKETVACSDSFTLMKVFQLVAEELEKRGMLEIGELHEH